LFYICKKNYRPIFTAPRHGSEVYSVVVYTSISMTISML